MNFKCSALTMTAAVTLSCCTASFAQKAPSRAVIQKDAYIVKARAYVDKSYSFSSRYDLAVLPTTKNPYHWDFTLDNEPSYHYTSLYSRASPTPFGSKTRTTIQATLHQFDVYEERVTFKNLNLGQLAATSPGIPTTARYLSLKDPITLTTPSGISVTLEAQGAETLEKVFSHPFSGNADAVFLQVKISPSKQEAVLAKSALYQKHQKPVRILLDCPAPNTMVWMADNTFSTLAVSVPGLQTASHLDTLTLVIRQRVDLKSTPLEVEVPVSRSSPK